MQKYKHWLLPYACKQWGVFLFVIAVLISFLLKVTDDHFEPYYLLAKRFISGVLWLSVILVVLSKEKLENKEINARRWFAFVATFIEMGLFVLMELFFEYWQWPQNTSLVYKILSQGMIVYLLNFYFIATIFSPHLKRT